MLNGYTMLGRPIDVVETSRGCTFDCSFCSIIEMRGRNFHTWSIDRVLADIADARAAAPRDLPRRRQHHPQRAPVRSACAGHHRGGLDDIHYIVQAMTSSIATSRRDTGPADAEAGFRYVFLGIENILDEDLVFLRPTAKNAQREQDGGRERDGGDRRPASKRDVRRRRPDRRQPGRHARLDRSESDVCREYVDWPYIQHPTPYPGTPMTQDFRENGLIVHETSTSTTALPPSCAPSAAPRNRVHALEGGTMDEVEALLARPRAQARVRCASRSRDASPHVPRQLAPVDPRSRNRPGRLSPLSGHSPAGAGIPAVLINRGLRPAGTPHRRRSRTPLPRAAPAGRAWPNMQQKEQNFSICPA